MKQKCTTPLKVDLKVKERHHEIEMYAAPIKMRNTSMKIDRPDKFNKIKCENKHFITCDETNSELMLNVIFSNIIIHLTWINNA